MPEIYARLVDGSGRPVSDQYRLTDNAVRSYEPSIATPGRDVASDIIVAWYDVAADDSSSVARIGAWTAAGTPRWTKTLSDPRRRGRGATVAVAGDVVHCVWIEETRHVLGVERVGKGAPGSRVADTERNVSAAIWAQQLGLDGEPLGVAQRIADASRTTWNLNLSVDAEGVPWVVFDAQLETRAHEIFLARLDRERAIVETVERRTTAHPPSIPTSLSAPDEPPSHGGTLAMATRRSISRSSTRRSCRNGVERAAWRVTDTAGESIGAYADWNGARFGLAWSDELEPGWPHEVYFQQFTAAGIPVRAPRRLTDNPTASLIPAIRAAGSRFALPGTKTP